MGGWTYNFYDYYVEGFTATLDEPGYAELAKIVDPYVYLGKIKKSFD